MAVNGAELLKQERGRVDVGGRSLPQYVRYRCGLPAALLANGNMAPQVSACVGRSNAIRSAST